MSMVRDWWRVSGVVMRGGAWRVCGVVFLVDVRAWCGRRPGCVCGACREVFAVYVVEVSGGASAGAAGSAG